MLALWSKPRPSPARSAVWRRAVTLALALGGTWAAPAAAADEEADEQRALPPLSVRVDPFNWLLEGRLGVELEVQAWKFITVEMVPVFVVNEEPPTLNLSSRESSLTQSSNGLGALSGASLGAGFWLGGTPFQGYVLRALFTNYGYTYQTRDAQGVVDELSHTERRFVVLLGSQSNFGPLAIGGGFGLGYELNQQSRCYLATGLSTDAAACRDALELAVDRSESSVVDVNGWAHPVYLTGRISLGVVF